MKKYITLFSLMTLFFIGIQQINAQEPKTRTLGEVENEKKEKVQHYQDIEDEKKRQNPEHKAKVAQLDKEEVTQESEEANQDSNQESNGSLNDLSQYLKLTPEQAHALQKIFNKTKAEFDEIGDDDKSKKAEDARAGIIKNQDVMIMKLVSEEQMQLYNEFKEKLKK